jgi:hypothetical protein
MNSSTTILLNIIGAENKCKPGKLNEFTSTGKEFKNFRIAGIVGINSVIGVLAYSAIKNLYLVNRNKKPSILPLIALGMSSYYLTTSYDYFLAQSYFGKVLKYVNIDDEVMQLIKEENE